MSKQIVIHSKELADLFRRIGTLGGNARAAALTPEERITIARLAANARWAKTQDSRGEQMNGKRLRWQDAPDKNGKRARVLDAEEPDEQEEEYEGAPIASFDGRHHVGRVDDAGNIHIHRRRERTTDTKTGPMSTQLKKLNEAQRAFWARKS